ncbi:MAG: hypothetical protein SF187_28170 [Deltaproteobacteria bacterium]|nr:hypothetical protein [Deltaproteobacteria bacterium]
MQTAQGNALEWEGGSIDDLVAMLALPALAVRVEVRTPAAGKPKKVGEIHMVAGGVYETIAGELRGDDAMEHLRGVSPLSFRLQPRLPNPDDGGLLIPGPGEGTLAERPPAELMRYCELYVLTCVLEIWRDTDRASITYTKGEIGSTIVNGSEASDRLAEVINWDSGGYRIVLADLSLPEPAKPTPKAAPAPARTMFGYPASGSTSQPVAVQTASARITPAAAEPVAETRPSTPVAAAPAIVDAPAPAAAPVEVAPTKVAKPEPAAEPTPQVAAREAKPAETKAAEVKPAAAQAEPKAQPAKSAAKPKEAKPEPKQPEARKTEPRKTAQQETRKTKKSKIPEKRNEELATVPVTVPEAPKKSEGSIWSAIALGLVVGLACAAIYWIIQATRG